MLDRQTKENLKDDHRTAVSWNICEKEIETILTEWARVHECLFSLNRAQSTMYCVISIWYFECQI
jgi:hypothetical protein